MDLKTFFSVTFDISMFMRGCGAFTPVPVPPRDHSKEKYRNDSLDTLFALVIVSKLKQFHTLVVLPKNLVRERRKPFKEIA